MVVDTDPRPKAKKNISPYAAPIMLLGETLPSRAVMAGWWPK